MNTDQGDTYVSSHAKAASTGSTQRQATGLGRIFGAALATRASSDSARGSGAPSYATSAFSLASPSPLAPPCPPHLQEGGRGRRHAPRSLALLTGLLALALLALAPTLASASVPSHPFLEPFGEAAQPNLTKVFGMTVDQASGDLLAIDPGGNEKQIVKFSSSPGWLEGDTFKLENLPTPACSSSVTDPITYSPTTATIRENIQNALGALCGGTANFKMAGSASAGVTIELEGPFAGEGQPLLTCLTESGSGTCTVERQQGGHAAGLYRYKPDGTPDDFSSLPANVITGLTFGTNAARAQVAVDNSGGATDGNIYVAQGGANPVKIFASDGSSVGELTEGTSGAFGEACGVAVDSSGNVYVGDRTKNSGEVHKFANPPVNGSSTDFLASTACGVAAGAGPTAGSIFAARTGKVTQFDSTTGTEVCEAFTGPNTTVSSDPASGHLFVASTFSIVEMNASSCPSTEVSKTTLGATTLAQSVAINWATGNMYTGRSGDPTISVWAPITGRHLLEPFGEAEPPNLTKVFGMTVDQASGDLLAIDPGGNEKQIVKFSSSPGWLEGDTFKLENLPTPACSSSVTDPITYSPTTATIRENIQNALGALCGGTANFKMAGSASAGVTIELEGPFAGEGQPLLTCLTESGSGTCTVERQQGGHAAGLYRYKPDGTPDDFSSLPANVITGLTFGTNAARAQVAVDNSGGATDGNIYVAQGGANPVKIFASDGSSVGELTEGTSGAFGEACGVAVDSSGNVYVGDRTKNSGEVHKFANPPVNGSSTDFLASTACGVAAGAGPTAGSIFAARTGKVTQFDSTTGTEVCEAFTGPNTTVSSDPASGHLFVASTFSIVEMNASSCPSTEVSKTTLGATTLAQSVAINWATGNMYTGRSSDPTISVWAPPAAPTVTAVSPDEGPEAGGQEVTIVGTNFQFGVDEVSFGGVPATAVSVNAAGTEIEATSPAGTGTFDVVVTTPGGPSATSSADHYTYVPPPVLTTVAPSEGPTAGGQVVTLTGEHFTGAEKIEFGTTAVTCDGTVAHCKVESDTEIKATTPALPAGSNPVSVTTPFGTSGTQPYTALEASVLSSCAPAQGPTAGGQVVTCTGEHFESGETEVEFGSTTAAAFSVESDTEIKATTPALTAGSQPLKVTTPGGASGTQPYTAVAAPVVSGVSPNHGPPHTAVTITGEHLTGATEVKFGGEAAASFSVGSDTEITAESPTGCESGTVDVTVTTVGGVSATSGADQFTCESTTKPAVSKVEPDEGPIGGGQAVVIEGSNFTGSTAVEFGSTPAASFSVESDTEIKATTPAHGEGSVDVTVTAPAGTSETSAADEYTFFAAPVLSGASPAAGPAAGGQVVTLTGEHFTSGATEVEFGSTPAAGFSVESDTEIKATTPALTAGSQPVKVTTPGGQSSTQPYTAVAAPAVTGVSPATGSEAGGAEVTIAGTDLTGASKVEFGTAEVECEEEGAAEGKDCEVLTGGTEIKAVTPAHALGAVHVTVTTVGGTSATSAADEYTYVVAPPVLTGVSPGEGPTAGGQVVTVTGEELGGAEKVEFGGAEVEAGEFLSASGTEIELESPEHAAGTVDVTVTGTNGASAISEDDEYTFVAPPAVTAVSPAAGPTAGGTVVTITGLRLGGALKVAFGSTEATILENTETKIKATAPAHAAGAVHVTVTTVGGTSGEFAADTYTYEAPAPPTPTPTPAPSPSPTPTPAPAPEGEGTAKAPLTAQVSGNKALIKLKCAGADACKGTLKLFVKLPTGKKHKLKNKQIGKAGFSMAKGKSKTIKVKIANGQVRKLLAKGKTLKAQLKGPGLKNRSIKLKPKKAQKKHKRHRSKSMGR